MASLRKRSLQTFPRAESPGNPYGSDDGVYTARLLWKTANTTWNSR